MSDLYEGWEELVDMIGQLRNLSAEHIPPPSR